MDLANFVGQPMSHAAITAPHQITHSNVMYITTYKTSVKCVQDTNHVRILCYISVEKLKYRKCLFIKDPNLKKN
jgi:hypothetical protein